MDTEKLLQIAYSQIVWNKDVNSFECPRCKKIVIYHYNDDWNYCGNCEKYFTQEEIFNGEEKKKIKFKVKQNKLP